MTLFSQIVSYFIFLFVCYLFMGNLSKENPQHLCGLRPTWREPNVTTTGTYGKRVVFNEACVKTCQHMSPDP